LTIIHLIKYKKLIVLKVNGRDDVTKLSLIQEKLSTSKNDSH